MSYQLNAAQLNSQTLNGAPTGIPPSPSDAIWYAGFGLQNAGVITQKLMLSPPAKALVERVFPRAAGEYAETSYDRRTLVTITGALTAATPAALDALMDQMNQAFCTDGGTLRVSRLGVARYYDQCYPLNPETLFDKRDFFHSTWCPFEIQLVCVTPYARSEARDVLITSGPATAALTTYVVTNGGNARTYPQWTIVPVTAGTLSSVVLTNATTGETMTVTAAFANGDYLSIDGEAKTVYRNGVAADYVGVIPSLLPGANAMTLALAGSGFSVSVTEKHYKRWL